MSLHPRSSLPYTPHAPATTSKPQTKPLPVCGHAVNGIGGVSNRGTVQEHSDGFTQNALLRRQSAYQSARCLRRHVALPLGAIQHRPRFGDAKGDHHTPSVGKQLDDILKGGGGWQQATE